MSRRDVCTASRRARIAPSLSFSLSWQSMQQPMRLGVVGLKVDGQLKLGDGLGVGGPLDVNLAERLADDGAVQAGGRRLAVQGGDVAIQVGGLAQHLAEGLQGLGAIAVGRPPAHHRAAGGVHRLGRLAQAGVGPGQLGVVMRTACRCRCPGAAASAGAAGSARRNRPPTGRTAVSPGSSAARMASASLRPAVLLVEERIGLLQQGQQVVRPVGVEVGASSAGRGSAVLRRALHRAAPAAGSIRA